MAMAMCTACTRPVDSQVKAGKSIPASEIFQGLSKKEGGAALIAQLQTIATTDRSKITVPAKGMVRVFPPQLLSDGPFRQVWTWLVVGSQVMHGSVGDGRVRLQTLKAGSIEAMNGCHVYVATLEFKQVLAEFAPVGYYNLTISPGTHGGHGKIGHRWTLPAETALPNLLSINQSEAWLETPGRVILAGLDGNLITLDVPEGKTQNMPSPRQAWTEWFEERARSGQKRIRPFTGDGELGVRQLQPIATEAEARSRALAFLAHYEVEDWGKPTGVTRTPLNHYRVEFSPSEHGQNRVLVVDPENGDVGYPRHPR